MGNLYDVDALTGNITTAGSITAAGGISSTSTTEGFLPPVMTTVQKNAIVSPATGLIVYDSTLNALQEFNGTSWESVGSPAGSNTQIQYNSSGSFAGSPNLTFDGTVLNIMTPTNMVNDGGGADLTLTSLGASGVGPNIILSTEPSSTFPISGGSITVTTGDSTANSGAHVTGGALTLTTGNSASSQVTGGGITLNTGNSAARVFGGSIMMTTGTTIDEIYGGSLTMTTGDETGNFAIFQGNFIYTTGNQTGPGGQNNINGGTVAFTTGNSTNGNVTGPNVTISSGTAGGTSTGGNLTLTAGTPANGGSLILTGTGPQGTPTTPLQGNIYANNLTALSLHGPNGLVIQSDLNDISFLADGILNFNMQLLSNVYDPINPQDAATKHYVDTHVSGGANYNDDVFSAPATGPNQTFTLTGTPVINTAIISHNGLVLRPTTDYTIVGTTLTIVENVVTGESIQATYAVTAASLTQVSSVNGLIGDVVLAAGSNITLTPSGNTITIAATAAAPAGSDTQLQFNNAGAFGASSSLTWDGTILHTSGFRLDNDTPDSFIFTQPSSYQQILFNHNSYTLWMAGNIRCQDQGGNYIFLVDTTNDTFSVGLPNGSFGMSAGLFTISSTVNGFVPPVMTGAQRDAIATPIAGTEIYNSDTNSYNFYNGTSWGPLGGGTPAGVDGQIQFNNAGSFGADTNLTYVGGILTLGLGISTPAIQITTAPTAGYVLTSDASGNGTWQAASGGNTVVTVTTTYTASTSNIIIGDATGGAFTITLPPAASSTNAEYTVTKKDSSANVITLHGNGSDTINGSNTQSLTTQYLSFTVVCDGTQWFII